MMLSAFYEKAPADVALCREGREREVFTNDYENISIKQMRLESPGGGPAGLLLFEFKTGPDGTPDGKPKAHDHPRE